MANQPTDKQINYILRLVNGRHDSDAFRAIAEDIGCSTSAAERRASSADASRTIERLTEDSSPGARRPPRAALCTATTSSPGSTIQ